MKDGNCSESLRAAADMSLPEQFPDAKLDSELVQNQTNHGDDLQDEWSKQALALRSGRVSEALLKPSGVDSCRPVYSSP